MKLTMIRSTKTVETFQQIFIARQSLLQQQPAEIIENLQIDRCDNGCCCQPVATLFTKKRQMCMKKTSELTFGS